MSSNSVCNHTRDWTNRTPATRSFDFVNHSYDYRPNWTPLSPVTITNTGKIDLKLDSVSLLTLITKLQSHLAFCIRRAGREEGNYSFSLDILNRDNYLCWRILEPILPSRSLPEGKILPAQTLHDFCVDNEHNLLCMWGNENYIKLILHSMKSKQKFSSLIGITFPYLIKDSVKLNGRNL